MKKWMLWILLLIPSLCLGETTQSFMLDSGITWESGISEVREVMGGSPAVLDREAESGVYALYDDSFPVSRYQDASFVAYFLQGDLAAAGYDVKDFEDHRRYEYLLSALESKYGTVSREGKGEMLVLLDFIAEMNARQWDLEEYGQWILDDGTRILIGQSGSKVKIYYVNGQLLTDWVRVYATDGL